MCAPHAILCYTKHKWTSSDKKTTRMVRDVLCRFPDCSRRPIDNASPQEQDDGREVTEWPPELCRWCGEEVRIEPVNDEGGGT